MCRRLFLCISLIIYFTHQVQAQVPFAQVNQLPLQWNPSMAGSKGKKRISFGMNALKQQQSSYSSMAVGYDQMLRKTGSGVGVYFSYRHLKDSSIEENEKKYLPEDIATQHFLNDQKQYVGGICIAPKYNIKSRSNFNKMKYTFSPSVFFEFGKIINSSVMNLDTINYSSTVFSATNPDGLTKVDSFGSDFVQYNFTNTVMRSGIGLQLNSDRLLVLSKITFERSVYHENTVKTYDANTKLQHSSQSNSTAVLYAIEPNVNIGYSFSKNEHFVFTPIVGVGMKHYFNLVANGNNPDAASSRFLLNNNSITQSSYIHMSANMRYNKVLFGFVYSKYYKYTYEGFTVGLQNNWMKMTGTLGVGIIKKNENYRLLELTADILIR